MKGLVVYESFFGNTERVAEEIGRALGTYAQVRAVRANEVDNTMLDEIDFLVVGSPTRKFRATPGVMRFLRGLSPGKLRNVKAAAFDTRVDLSQIKSPLFRFIVGSAGYAAKPIAKLLERSGARVVAEPEGFIVTGTEGPLKEGEIQRATHWAQHLQQATAG